MGGCECGRAGVNVGACVSRCGNMDVGVYGACVDVSVGGGEYVWVC